MTFDRTDQIALYLLGWCTTTGLFMAFEDVKSPFFRTLFVSALVSLAWPVWLVLGLICICSGEQ
jgi:hypothetical protein